MKKLLLVILLIVALVAPNAVSGNENPEEQRVKQMISSYFDMRYDMLSTLTFNDQIKGMLDPDLIKVTEMISEADILDTIIMFRKSQLNDLRFDRHKLGLLFDKVEVVGDQAWISVNENYELYFNCAPTVKNSASVQHIISARNVNGNWYIVKDDYEDPEGIKKKLVKYFTEQLLTVEEAKKMLITEAEDQMSGRMTRLASIVDEIKDQNPLIFHIGKSIAYAGGTAMEVDKDHRVTPIIIKDKTLLPLNFIAEKMEAQLQWNPKTSTALISTSSHKIEIKTGQRSLIADGKKIVLDVPAQLVQNKVYIPLKALIDVFGKKAFWDDSGLIILTDKELDADKHSKAIRQLVEFYDVLFTKADFPRIDGSTATYPLSIEIGKQLLGLDETGAKGFITHHTTHNAYVNLIEGNTDIIFVTQPSPEELKLAAEKNIELEVVPICQEGFVFLVNKDNPVKNLTTKQVQDIYQGKIRNWKEVGGDNNDVIAYQREPNSGSQTLMENTVMKGMKLMEPPRETLVYGMGELIDRVADYSNAKNALGYSVFYYATQMYQNRSIRLLSIDGVEPTKQSIKEEKYPFTVGYYAVVRKSDPLNSNSRKLLQWLLGEEGQTVVDKAGLVPIQ